MREDKIQEVNQDQFAREIFGGATAPGPLSNEDRLALLIYSTEYDIKEVIKNMRYSPDGVMRLHHLIQYLEIIATRKFLGDDWSDEIREVKKGIPKKIPTDPVGIANYVKVLLQWFERIHERLVEGIGVRPEIPVEMNIIGRETYESAKIGEVEVGDTEKEGNQGTDEEVGRGREEDTGEGTREDKEEKESKRAEIDGKRSRPQDTD